MPDHLDKQRLIRFAEVSLIAFVILVFCLSAGQSVWILLDENRNLFDSAMPAGPDAFLFFSIVTMVIAGLGLIVLLLLKLKNIERIHAKNQELQQQFYHAQKMEALGRMAGGVAHDFNNILASMMGYAEFLLDDLEQDSEQHRFVRQIEQGGRQARNLVEQILTFSRRRDHVTQPVNLVNALLDTVNMLGSTCPATIKVIPEVYVPEAFIMANTSQVSQVLINLCVNAQDAMDGAHGELRISLRHVAAQEVGKIENFVSMIPTGKGAPPLAIRDAGNGETHLQMGVFVPDHDYFCLSIADTGAGMSRDIMEHIFEPFYTTKHIDKGTGLGLASVLGIMTDHKGVVAVKSRPGHGTVFELYFPAQKQGVPALTPQPPPTREKGLGGYIMLVDDNESVCDMIIKMIRRLGYDVCARNTGPDAIDCLRENPGRFDLVISDFSMPHMTGVEMAEEIHLDFPELPVILITGYSEEKLDDVRSRHPGIRMVLKKPVESRVLGRAIADVLGQSKKAA
ncbi:MAG: response regulator [Rhodospirillales bacterium]|nr:response regulator [Rhodospirillales bacterium]